MIGKRLFDKYRNEIQFNPNKNLNEKLLYETVTPEYCEIQAKIAINKATETRAIGPINYDAYINEAIMLLLLARLKHHESSKNEGK
jgi:hypothetical protein